MKKLFLLFMMNALSAMAQIEPIQADRPDQTETPAIVPKGMFQLESGFSYQKEDAQSDSYAVPAALWKYGVNENFELRLITELAGENATENTFGLLPVLVGCKIKVCEERGIVPKTSLIGHMSIPQLASSDYKADFYAPEFRFVMQHTLSEKFSLSYNLGSEWDGFSAEPTFLYTLTIGYSITEKLGSYIECFGFAPQQDTAYHSLDGGLTYLFNNDFMLDVSSGFGITENAPDYYVALGFSIRR